MIKKILLSLALLATGNVFATTHVKVNVDYYKVEGSTITGNTLCKGELTYEESKENQIFKVKDCFAVGSQIPVDLSIYASSGRVEDGKAFTVSIVFDNEDSHQVWSVANNKDETKHSISMKTSPPQKWIENMRDMKKHWITVAAIFTEKQ